MRHLATQICAFDIGLAVVDAAPYTGIDDLLYQVICILVVARPLYNVGSCTSQVQLDPLRAQNLDVHFRLR